MADTERVMQHRALGVARGDQASFPPFEQDDYAKTSGHGERTWSSLLDEFKAVRQSSIHLFQHLDEASLDRVGSVNQNPTTARAVGYVIVGHERHHLAILKEQRRPPRPWPTTPGVRPFEWGDDSVVGRSGEVLALRAPRQARRQDLLQQRLVGDAGVVRRLGEVLAVGELRIRVRLEHVDAAVGVEPQIDARVAGEIERAVDAAADLLQAACTAPRADRRPRPLVMPCFFW